MYYKAELLEEILEIFRKLVDSSFGELNFNSNCTMDKK